MNGKNEQLAAVGLLSLIFLVIIGAGGYFFFYKPIKSRKNAIAQLDRQNKEKREKIDEAVEKVKKVKQWKQRSLPPDVDDAQIEYERLLGGMLRDSGFSESTYRIAFQPPDADRAPALIGKRRPAYTVLTYTVTKARGSLGKLIAFLERFYKAKLLHRVTRIKVTRVDAEAGSTKRPPRSGRPGGGFPPGGARRGGTGGDERLVEASLTVEALVVDKAEEREQIMPKGEVDVNVLAAMGRSYEAVTSRDLFHGPKPKPPVKEERPEDPDWDFRPYTSLTAIHVADDGSAEAHIWDASQNKRYVIKRTSSGRIKSFVRGEAAADNPDGLLPRRGLRTISFADEDNDHYAAYRGVELRPGGLYLRPKDEELPDGFLAGVLFAGGPAGERAPRVYRWRVGDKLADLEPIPGDDALKLLGGKD